MGIHNRMVNIFCRVNGKMDKNRLKKKIPFEKIEKIYDIPYAEGGNNYNLLDIYYPEGNIKKLPVIIDIHGGGWVYGTKDINAHYCQGLASYGFVVVNISYRLIKKNDGGSFPNNIIDIFKAFEWVEKNITSYNGDISNIFLTGDSAGAHLSALALGILVDGKLKEKLNITNSIKFKAAGLTCGVFDLDIYERMRLPIIKYLFKQFFGKDYKNSEFRKYATITNNRLEEYPPLFLNSCYGDFLKRQTLSFYEECVKRKIEVELKYIERKRRNRLYHVYSVLFPEYPESVETTEAMIDFFRRHLD